MKRLLSIILILTLCCSVVFAQSIDAKVNSGLDSFVESLANTIPASSSTIGVWNNAYIGQLLAFPPHLGAGVTVGATKFDISGIKKAASSMNIPAVSSLPNDLIFPTYSLDAIIGGLILPFDLSGFVTYIPEGKLNYKSMEFTNLSYGVKLRCPLLKENILLPGISVGVGYSKNEGKLTAGDASKNIAVDYSTTVYSGEAQLSKTILIFTPYVGARALASQSENSYAWNVGPLSDKGTYVTPKDSSKGLQGEFLVNPQIFGGLSFNILILNISTNAAYDLVSKMWSGSLSVHVKL